MLIGILFINDILNDNVNSNTNKEVMPMNRFKKFILKLTNAVVTVMVNIGCNLLASVCLGS